MWETWVQSLGWDEPLEKEMATHSSILAWKIPWTEDPGRLQSTGSQRVGHDCHSQSCWGFSFALGVKPCFSLYSAYQTMVFLTLDVGYLHTDGPAKCNRYS